MVMRGLVSDQITLNISLVTYFSKKVGISPAVIQSFTTLSSFTTALAFYLLYGEKLKMQHIAGMLMIMASVMIVAVSKSMQTMVHEDFVEFIDESD